MINLTIYEQAVDSRPWDGADGNLCLNYDVLPIRGIDWNYQLLLHMLCLEVGKQNKNEGVDYEGNNLRAEVRRLKEEAKIDKVLIKYFRERVS